MKDWISMMGRGCVVLLGLGLWLGLGELYAIGVADFKQSQNIDVLDFLTGRFDPAEAVEFMKIKPPYAARPMYIRIETFRAFKRMRDAALKDGVKLFIVSGFRSYYDQVDIWERNYKRVSLSEVEARERVLKLLHYSAPPGFSRHHWGCEIDLNSVSPAFFNTVAGQKIGKWLEANAKRFDFYLTYNAGRLKGFKSEPWQYTYYPTASKMMTFFRLYVSSVNVDEFKGSHAVNIEDILDEYTFFINPEILVRMQLEGKITY